MAEIAAWRHCLQAALALMQQTQRMASQRCTLPWQTAGLLPFSAWQLQALTWRHGTVRAGPPRQLAEALGQRDAARLLQQLEGLPGPGKVGGRGGGMHLGMSACRQLHGMSTIRRSSIAPYTTAGRAQPPAEPPAAGSTEQRSPAAAAATADAAMARLLQEEE